jgi:subtilisin family serine protease
MDTIDMADFTWKTLLFPLALASVGGCGLDPRAALPRGRAPLDDALQSVVVKATARQIEKGEVLPGSYIVTFKTEIGGPGLEFTDYGAEFRGHYRMLAESYLPDPRVKDIRFLTAIDLSPVQRSGQELGFGAPFMQRLTDHALDGGELIGSMNEVSFTSAADAADVLDLWNAQGRLWFAEPNYVSHLSVKTEEEASEDGESTGNYFKDLSRQYAQYDYWWLKAVNLSQAYESIGNRDLNQPDTPNDETIKTDRPIVAVLDSGVDYEHPALKDRIWVNNDQNAANCANDLHGCNTTTAKRGLLGDGNVYPYDANGPGENCQDRDPNCSHGTHVAGLIAADHTWTDATGRSAPGVCPVCQIMILKIVSKVGNDSGILDSSIIAAFKYVTLFKRENSGAVRVINASFGKFVRARAVGLLVRLMKEKRGTLLVGAAGNEDTLTQEYPAAFPDAIAVAAVDQELRKVGFSNFGRWVDISAPGNALVSTVPGQELDAKSGTSMATPMVAGVAGLMLARYPGISFTELRKWLLDGADPTFYQETFAGGFNYYYYYPKVPQESVRQPLLGYGVLNANSTINKTPSQDLPIYTSLDRVNAGCATVSGRADASPWFTLLILLIPLVTFVYRHRPV